MRCFSFDPLFNSPKHLPYTDQLVTAMITVSIIENDRRYRQTVVLYLQKAADICVDFAVDSLSDLFSFNRSAPDVTIIGISSRQDSTIDGVSKVKAMFPDTKVVVLTDFDKEEAIIRSVQMGAVGYLLRKNPPTNILDAVRRVDRGEAALSGVVARTILDYLQLPVQRLQDLEANRITKREGEVLDLLMAGLSYKAIAARCFVSVDTINSHVRKLYKKLNVRSRAEITARFRLK